MGLRDLITIMLAGNTPSYLSVLWSEVVDGWESVWVRIVNVPPAPGWALNAAVFNVFTAVLHK